MISRSNIVAIDQGASALAVSEYVDASPRSRYPVVDGDLDHVIGMLHIKDFVRADRLGAFTSLGDLVRPLPVVAATTSAEDLLEQFKRGSAHAALVVDEFGATVGFVSLDDVIDEVMDDEHADGVVRHADGSLTVLGETTLFELRQELDDTSFDHEDIVTIAGLVLAHSGSVPELGDSVTHEGHELVVEEIDGRRITKVRIRPT